jgi:[ribosomal protein S18]-alanine N-acetyltransferase
VDGITVAPMAERHLDALVRLEQACFSEPWTRTGLAEEIGNPAAVFAVAEYGGETVGYAGMHCVCGECYVDNVAVFPEFRRKGAATALLSYLIDRAKERDGAFLTLEVRESNFPARETYAAFGFREEGRRKNFYRGPAEDALILTLRFPEPKCEEELP